MTNSNISKAANAFFREEDGASTTLGLFIALTTLTVGGLAVDVSHAYLARTELQNATDAAAHAALMTRETEDSIDARLAAVELVSNQMTTSRMQGAITEDDIQFGYWDANAQAFQIDDDSRDGVIVVGKRLEDRQNGITTNLLKFAGIGNLDVVASTVFLTDVPACLTEGFVGVGRVDMQSGNSFTGEFCVHSNSYVSFNNNNTFETGTTVSMPSLELLELPSSGFKKNEGLEDALREGYYNIRILNHVETIIEDLAEYGSLEMPDYIDRSSKVTLNSIKNLTESNFTEGAIHEATCSGNQTLSIKSNTTLENIVLVTNCKVSLGQGVALEDAVIATTNDDAKSITGSSGVVIGADDDCSEGGGAQLVTMGGMSFPSNLSLFGGQLLALGDVTFAAQANGIMGASIIAAGEIDGTSQTSMGHCAGSGMEANFEKAQFRMAI